MDIRRLLGDDAEALLDYECKGIPRDDLILPGPDFIDRVFVATDRSPQVLRSMQQLFGTGRLANKVYIYILPVEHGIEHSDAARFAPNPK